MKTWNKQPPTPRLGSKNLYSKKLFREKRRKQKRQDKEDEEERVERRKALLEAWKGCQDGLPEELQSMYSGQSLGIKGAP